MIQLQIEDSVSRAEKLLAGIPNGVQKAVKNAMTRGVSTLRTNSTRVIRERYDISAANVRPESGIKIRYSYQDGVSATVLFSGRRIPLYRYGGTSPREPARDSSRTVRAMVQGQWRIVHPGLAAAGHVLKSTSPTTFRNAFVAQMRSGHLGIFERTGGENADGSDAIRELMGLSVPQMLESEAVREKLAEVTRQKIEERLEHEIVRIINGYGG